MKNVSNWVAAVMLLLLAVILLSFYILQEKRINAANNRRLLFINDSLNSINTLLNAELEKARQQLKNSEKTPPLAQTQNQ